MHSQSLETFLKEEASVEEARSFARDLYQVEDHVSTALRGAALADIAERPAGGPEFGNLLPVRDNPRAPADPALFPCPREAGEGALAEPDALLFRDRRQNRQHGIPENPARIQILHGQLCSQEFVARCNAKSVIIPSSKAADEARVIDSLGRTKRRVPGNELRQD
jgi:hypothetical protein